MDHKHGHHGCCGCFSSFQLNRRTFLASTAALTLAGRSAVAQEQWSFDLENACSFYPEDELEAEIYTFGSVQQAQEVVQKIADAVGLEPNFQVLQANVPNASAVIQNGQRFILYSQVFIAQITQSAATEWASWTIMAHEVGHHLNGHTLSGAGSRPPIELQADRFAGHAVARMGGTLQQAQSPYQQMDPAGSPTHPPRSARLEAVTKGWTQAQNGKAPDKPKNEQPGVGDVANTLKITIEQIRAGTPPYNKMTPQLASAVQQQLQMVIARIQQLGAVRSTQQKQQQTGPDGATYYQFDVGFQNGQTTWQIGLMPDGTMTALYFQ
ncbi:M48 family metalloprotease [Hyphomicrobium sp. CS1GBMeth3]|uniref:M48 family metalloprotease n=1 Tax=Hyphomicrobium sp. CS1GBMeth3 TaxID=1892845 RepID=UPI000931B5D4|nr:M48 family metalloprotease [Hyphomicrobium sp. CS1GBMeth3]